MGLVGASAGALSGVVVQAWGYPTLTALAALTTAPLILLVAWPTNSLEDSAVHEHAVEEPPTESV
jgi:hypothetical protein